MRTLLPRLAVVLTVLGWGFTLWIVRARELQVFAPPALTAFFVFGLAPLLASLFQVSNARAAGALMWLGAGAWAGASYLNLLDLGFIYLIVALVQLAAAVILERGGRGLSIAGPAAFVAAILIMIIIPRMLAQ